ncbi:MAG: helix-hairpin-helix domain-containing protein [Planctomycetaceae bacterium]
MTVHAKNKTALSNSEVAERLDELADRLDAQQANGFRVRAYRTAAETIRSLEGPVAELVESEGMDGLTRLPGIGPSLARTITRLTRSRRVPLLERLRRDTMPEAMFATVPGIGREMAARIHEATGIETLADLETAAYDGRLSRVPGIGPKRILAVRESLASRFRRRPEPARRMAMSDNSIEPPVDHLLSLDKEYREKAASDRLPRIAPRRFNPTGVAWLPVWETQRGEDRYTVMYSNTARAHELGAVHDWVVIYCRTAGPAAQWTIVTSQFGALKGRRIVRGREAECRRYYAASNADGEQSPVARTLFSSESW